VVGVASAQRRARIVSYVGKASQDEEKRAGSFCIVVSVLESWGGDCS
jgi:hypothetical protein